MNDDHAGVGGVAEQLGQDQQRRAPQGVVDAQQHPRVDAVAQPAGEDRPGDVEDADDGQERGRDRFGHAVVVGGRDEVGADQAVGGRAADGEAAGQVPERPGAGGVAQRPDRAGGRPRPWRGRRAAGARWRRTGEDPTSAGWSRTRNQTSGTTASAQAATTSEAARQPVDWTSSASTGRKMSCPVRASGGQDPRSPGPGCARTTAGSASRRRPAPSTRCPARRARPSTGRAASSRP